MDTLTQKTLKPRQRRAILALIEHGSVTEAAQVCGVSRAALYRWMREADFAQALKDASGEQVELVSRRLTSLVLTAVDVLESLMSSPHEQQRRLAADSVISHALRLRELVELEERITRLENTWRIK